MVLHEPMWLNIGASLTKILLHVFAPSQPALQKVSRGLSSSAFLQIMRVCGVDCRSGVTWGEACLLLTETMASSTRSIMTLAPMCFITSSLRYVFLLSVPFSRFPSLHFNLYISSWYHQVLTKIVPNFVMISPVGLAYACTKVKRNPYCHPLHVHILACGVIPAKCGVHWACSTCVCNLRPHQHDGALS